MYKLNAAEIQRCISHIKGVQERRNLRFDEAAASCVISTAIISEKKGYLEGAQVSGRKLALVAGISFVAGGVLLGRYLWKSKKKNQKK